MIRFLCLQSKFQQQYHNYNQNLTYNDAPECLLQLLDYNCNYKFDDKTLKYNISDIIYKDIVRRSLLTVSFTFKNQFNFHKSP